MRGFDPRFRDFPDYLASAAGAFWSGRGHGAAARAFCHPHLILRRPDRIAFGPDAVMADAMELAAALPDHGIRVEDAIWSGAPQVGMLGSTRLTMRGNHDGEGVFGAPTGRRVRYRALADLYAKDNSVSEAWVIRDTGALLRQIGLSVPDWAREQVSARDPDTQPFRPEIDQPGPYTGTGNANQWGQAFAALLTQIMQGDFSAFPAQYDPAARVSYPRGLDAQGAGAAERFWLGLRGALPTARFQIHHQIGMEDRMLPPRAALRWSLTGRHDGWGPFGKPTGATLYVMGISQAEFGPNGLRREWTLFDETAVWMQIHCATGAVAGARPQRELKAI